MGKKSSQPLKIFYCYAHEDHALREELDKHLTILRRSGLITPWYDGEIVAGAPWEKAIEDHLKTADMILLLVSSDFLHSNYCYSREMKHAIRRHQAGSARVIPVLLRPVDSTNAPFSTLQVLPSGARPVTLWPDRDEAFEDVAKGIRRVVEELLQTQLAFRKGWLAWIIALLFVLAGTIQITCLLLGWESPESIAVTILSTLIAVMMLIQLNPALPDWPLSKSSFLFIKLASNHLFQKVIFILLILAIIALSTFASLSAIFATTQVSQLEFPGPPRSDTLLTNGNFEQGTASWDCTAGMDILVHHEGGKSWLQAKTPLAGPEVICSQIVHFKPQVGKTYTASLWVHATTTPIGGHIALWMFDDHTSGRNINSQKAFTAKPSQWIIVTTAFTVSYASYTSMVFEIDIHDSGEVSLDITAAQLTQDPL